MKSNVGILPSSHGSYSIRLTWILSLVVAFQIEGNTTPSPPNILFILSDDHTSQAWGIYGGILAPYVKNDNIKRLAAARALTMGVARHPGVGGLVADTLCNPA